MTEQPQDPTASNDPQHGYQPPPSPAPQPGNVVPMGGASAQPAGAPTGPYSELVGRPLTSDETMWSMLAHIGGIVLGFLAPLIVMLTKGNESAFTKDQSVEALNFQITLAIGWIAASVLSAVLIGLFLYPVLFILNIVFCVMAGMAANKGETYRYPFALRLVK